ncbi:MAG: hypothetical protein ACI8ZM_003869 [Crocinitomix sp.]|jgi:hypothetical protein
MRNLTDIVLQTLALILKKMKAIRKLEKILGVKLEAKRFGDSYDPNQKNTYSMRNEQISRLRLDDLIIADFSKLFPYLKELSTLKIKNSTIPNFAELLNLNCYDLELNNVVFKNNNCDTKGKVPGHLKFTKMKFDASCLRCFKKSNVKGFVQVEFRKCHIDNIQHINDIEPVSLLIFDKITFTHQPKKTAKKSTWRLSIYNSNLKDVTFLPFSDSLGAIEFRNCQIGSIAGLTKFPRLGAITIDSDSKIEDKTIQDNNENKKITCVLNQGKRPLDVRMVSSLQKYIHELQLDNYTEKTIDFIEEFKCVKHLLFSESKVYVNAFIAIAAQIERISFTNSIIKKSKYFGSFKNLNNFYVQNYGENDTRFNSFEKILPLKNQLKVLDIYDSNKIKSPHLIAEFKALESLKIAYGIPVKTAEYILTLKNLKKLSLEVNYKKRTLDLGNLKKIEFLILETGVNFKGFEKLKKLKSLKIGGDMSEPSIDINSLPKLKNLKRLNITSYNCKIKRLEQFPNLEYLRIKGCPQLKLTRLKKLKVLDLFNSKIENFSTFKKLPNLKKLDLSSVYTELDLEGLHKFPNLKVLTLAESDVSDIKHLEPLKKLQFLDLYYTRVSDVRVLNTLPNLKEVNLATYTNHNLEEQLDKPEIAVYCGLPSVYISIWRKDEFEI